MLPFSWDEMMHIYVEVLDIEIKLSLQNKSKVAIDVNDFKKDNIPRYTHTNYKLDVRIIQQGIVSSFQSWYC